MEFISLNNYCTECNNLRQWLITFLYNGNTNISPEEQTRTKHIDIDEKWYGFFAWKATIFAKKSHYCRRPKILIEGKLHLPTPSSCLKTINIASRDEKWSQKWFSGDWNSLTSVTDIYTLYSDFMTTRNQLRHTIHIAGPHCHHQYFLRASLERSLQLISLLVH